MGLILGLYKLKTGGSGTKSCRSIEISNSCLFGKNWKVVSWAEGDPPIVGAIGVDLSVPGEKEQRDQAKEKDTAVQHHRAAVQPLEPLSDCRVSARTLKASHLRS